MEQQVDAQHFLQLAQIIGVMSNVTKVRTLLNKPETFNKLAKQYDSDVDCYEQLLTQAKQSLETFDDYAEFYSICLEYGPTSYVQSQLERNATRSLKNMVLQTSTSGKRFPIRTVAQLRQRINTYRDLGVESVTSQSVAFTLLEHIFDDDSHEPHAYEILSRLLSSQPSSPGELTAILTRARFVVAAETASRQISMEIYSKELFTDFPDPRPNDKATAAKQLKKSKERDYSDREKVDLAASALSRGGNAEILEEYLYLTARDVVERYRHGQRDDPWRGELQLTLRQWNCILNAFSETHSDERRSRSQSYRNLVLGELRSGGRWRSQRDKRQLPEANFLSAADKYYSAAHKIREIDSVRYIKYISKSFRHQATGAHHREWGPCRGWLATQLMHGQAVKIVTDLIDDGDTTERLKETIIETAAFHNFRGHRAAAVVAFERRNPESLSNEINEARSYLDTVPGSPSEDLLNALEILEQALIFEDTGEFTEALKQYRKVSHPKLDLRSRIRLVELKRAISDEQSGQAKDIAEDEFDDSSPISVAVSLVTGGATKPPSIKPPVLAGVTAVNEEVKWRFTYLVHLVSSTDSDYRSNQVEHLLYQL